MNTINQSASQVFSFQRFAALLKTYFVENGKTLGLYTAALIGLAVLCGAFCGHLFGSDSASTGMMFMFVTLAGIFGLTISASLTFTSMQSQASRIATLMLPASMLEKFLVRVTVYFFTFIVCFFIAVLCGEGTRLLLSADGTMSIFQAFNELLNIDVKGGTIAASAIGIKDGIKGGSIAYKVIAICIVSTIANYSFYALGSSLWPKHSFFKTFVVQMILQMIVSTVMLPLYFPYMDNILEILLSSWTYIISQLVVALICLSLAWWRFRTTQIVQRFMNN